MFGEGAGQTHLTFERNIIVHMLHTFDSHVPACWMVLWSRKSNRSAHAPVQQCCTNVAKRVQHHATSINVARKMWTFSKLIQHHPTCWPNMSNLFYATATATKTSLNVLMSSTIPCTCVITLGTFLSRPLQNNNVKWQNSGFSENVNHDGDFFKFLFRIQWDLYIFSRG